jgi:hypothetical protein
MRGTLRGPEDEIGRPWTSPYSYAMLPRPMPLSALERRVIACLPDIDPDKVGDVLGVGAQSLVRSYDAGGRPQVIKLPVFHVRRGVYAQTMGRVLGQQLDGAKAELDTCAAYFGPYMVPTRIVSDPRTGFFCVLQDRIPLDEVTPKVLAGAPGLDDQLGGIMEANRRMIVERGQWLDAMGWRLPKFIRFLTWGTPYLENVALDARAQALRLFDFGLFPMPHRSPRPLRGYYRLLLGIQRRNMRSFGHTFAPASQ